MVALPRRLAAEFIGTFWLVFAGCGAALFAAGVPVVGIGYLGVAFAFGLSVLTMAYAVGHISGCHLNPAVSIGLTVAGRFSAKDLLPYIIAQLLGGIVAAGILFCILSNQVQPQGLGQLVAKPAAEIMAGACNGYGEHSPQGYAMFAGFLAETVLTFMFLIIILGATDKRAPAGFAPIAIGLGLTLILLVGIPVTNLSVNPARSTATAIFAGNWALSQLWLFWVAPILGGLLAGVVYPLVAGKAKD